MKTITKLVALLIVAGWASLANAGPILAPDGSLLRNVEANGLLYDVTFGDAVLGDVYTLAQVEAPGWLALSQSISLGIVAALNSLGYPVSNSDINGCKDGPGFPPFAPPNMCVIILPQYVQYYDGVGSFAADNLPVLYGDGGTAFYRSNGFAVGVNTNTSANNFIGDLQTVAVFRLQQTPIPVPATLALMYLGLIGVGISRRNNTTIPGRSSHNS